MLGTFAGTTTPEKTVNSSGSSLTVQFKSDAFMELHGFQAKYEFRRKSECNVAATTTTTEKPTEPKMNDKVNELLSEVPYDTVVTVSKSHIMKCTPRKSTTIITW